MNLLFYSRETNGAAGRLQRVIETVVPQEKREIFRTMVSLLRRLRRPRHDVGIVILFAASREDLMEFLYIRDLLNGVRIILVLPDGEEETVAKAHILRPRFLTYADSDFLEVVAVLGKIYSLETHPAAMGVNNGKGNEQKEVRV